MSTQIPKLVPLNHSERRIVDVGFARLCANLTTFVSEGFEFYDKLFSRLVDFKVDRNIKTREEKKAFETVFQSLKNTYDTNEAFCAVSEFEDDEKAESLLDSLNEWGDKKGEVQLFQWKEVDNEETKVLLEHIAKRIDDCKHFILAMMLYSFCSSSYDDPFKWQEMSTSNKKLFLCHERNDTWNNGVYGYLDWKDFFDDRYKQFEDFELDINLETFVDCKVDLECDVQVLRTLAVKLFRQESFGDLNNRTNIMSDLRLAENRIRLFNYKRPLLDVTEIERLTNSCNEEHALARTNCIYSVRNAANRALILRCLFNSSCCLETFHSVFRSRYRVELNSRYGLPDPVPGKNNLLQEPGNSPVSSSQTFLVPTEIFSSTAMTELLDYDSDDAQ